MSRPKHRSLEEEAIFGRKDRAIAVEPNIIKVSSIPVPSDIADNPDKLALWTFLTEDLAKRKLLATSYTQIIAILVNNVFLYNQYLPMLEDAGPLIPRLAKDGETITGYEENPIFSMVKRLEATIIKTLEKLGLTPRDIIYLSNPDAAIPIEAITEEKKKLTYFR